MTHDEALEICNKLRCSFANGTKRFSEKGHYEAFCNSIEKYSYDIGMKTVDWCKLHCDFVPSIKDFCNHCETIISEQRTHDKANRFDDIVEILKMDIMGLYAYGKGDVMLLSGESYIVGNDLITDCFSDYHTYCIIQHKNLADNEHFNIIIDSNSGFWKWMKKSNPNVTYDTDMKRREAIVRATLKYMESQQKKEDET